MGKKGARRKTRWRALSIGSPPGEEDEEDGGGKSQEQQGHGPNQRRSYKDRGEGQQTWVKSRHGSAGSSGSNGNGHASNGSTSGYCSAGSRSRRDDSPGSHKGDRIVFNEAEYTRITTPRQDVLFKKGYLTKRRTWTSTPSVSATPSTVESQSASQSTADGSEAAEDQQLLDSSGSAGTCANSSIGTDYCPGVALEAGPVGPHISYGAYYEPSAAGYYYECPMMLVGPAIPGEHMGHGVLAAMPCTPVPLRPIEWVDPAYVPKLASQQYCYMNYQASEETDCATLVDAQGVQLTEVCSSPTHEPDQNGLSSEQEEASEKPSAPATADKPASADGSVADEPTPPDEPEPSEAVPYEPVEAHQPEDQQPVVEYVDLTAAYVETLPPQPMHLAHVIPQPLGQPYLYPGQYMFGPPLLNVDGMTIQSGHMLGCSNIMAGPVACTKRRRKKKKRKQRRLQVLGNTEDEEEEDYSSEAENGRSSRVSLSTSPTTTTTTTTTTATTTTKPISENSSSSGNNNNQQLNPECEEFRPPLNPEVPEFHPPSAIEYSAAPAEGKDANIPAEYYPYETMPEGASIPADTNGYIQVATTTEYHENVTDPNNYMPAEFQEEATEANGFVQVTAGVKYEVEPTEGNEQIELVPSVDYREQPEYHQTTEYHETAEYPETVEYHGESTDPNSYIYVPVAAEYHEESADANGHMHVAVNGEYLENAEYLEEATDPSGYMYVPTATEYHEQSPDLYVPVATEYNEQTPESDGHVYVPASSVYHEQSPESDGHLYVPTITEYHEGQQDTEGHLYVPTSTGYHEQTPDSEGHLYVPTSTGYHKQSPETNGHLYVPSISEYHEGSPDTEGHLYVSTSTGYHEQTPDSEGHLYVPTSAGYHEQTPDSEGQLYVPTSTVYHEQTPESEGHVYVSTSPEYLESSPDSDGHIYVATSTGYLEPIPDSEGHLYVPTSTGYHEQTADAEGHIYVPTSTGYHEQTADVEGHIYVPTSTEYDDQTVDSEGHLYVPTSAEYLEQTPDSDGHIYVPTSTGYLEQTTDSEGNIYVSSSTYDEQLPEVDGHIYVSASPEYHESTQDSEGHIYVPTSTGYLEQSPEANGHIHVAGGVEYHEEAGEPSGYLYVPTSTGYHEQSPESNGHLYVPDSSEYQEQSPESEGHLYVPTSTGYHDQSPEVNGHMLVTADVEYHESAEYHETGEYPGEATDPSGYLYVPGAVEYHDESTDPNGYLHVPTPVEYHEEGVDPNGYVHVPTTGEYEETADPSGYIHVATSGEYHEEAVDQNGYLVAAPADYHEAVEYHEEAVDSNGYIYVAADADYHEESPEVDGVLHVGAPADYLEDATVPNGYMHMPTSVVEYHDDTPEHYIPESPIAITRNNHVDNEATRLNDSEPTDTMYLGYDYSEEVTDAVPTIIEENGTTWYPCNIPDDLTNGDLSTYQNGYESESLLNGDEYQDIMNGTDSQRLPSETSARSTLNNNGALRRKYGAKTLKYMCESTPEADLNDLDASKTAVIVTNDDRSVEEVTAMLNSTTLIEAQVPLKDGDLDICLTGNNSSSIASESYCNEINDNKTVTKTDSTKTTMLTTVAVDEDSGIESQSSKLGSLSRRPITDAVKEWLERANSPNLFIKASALSDNGSEDEDEDDASVSNEPPKNLQGNPMPALSVNAGATSERRALQRSEFANDDDDNDDDHDDHDDDDEPSEVGSLHSKTRRSRRNLHARTRAAKKKSKEESIERGDNDALAQERTRTSTGSTSKKQQPVESTKVGGICELIGEDSDVGMRVAEKPRINASVPVRTGHDGETKSFKILDNSSRRRRRRSIENQPVKTFEKGEIVVSMDGELLEVTTALPDAQSISSRQRKVSSSSSSSSIRRSLGSIEEPDVLECWEAETVEPVVSTMKLLEDGPAEEELPEPKGDNNAPEHVQRYYRLQVDTSDEEDDIYVRSETVRNSPESSSESEEEPVLEERPQSVASRDECTLPVDEAFEVYESCYTGKSLPFDSIQHPRFGKSPWFARDHEAPIPCKNICCNIQ